MKKARINLELLLPELPDERDQCVSRIIGVLQDQQGIDRVHIVPSNGVEKAQLCFHYNPSVVTLNRVEQLARNAGAKITEQFGHIVVETSGVRHPRQARLIEDQLRDSKGIKTVSVSGTGFVSVEYGKGETKKDAILQQINKTGLRILDVDDSQVHKHGIQPPSKEERRDDSAQAHDRPHTGPFGEKTELSFAIICGVFLGVGFGLSFFNFISPTTSIVLYLLAYLFGGFYTTKEAVKGISQGDFQIDFLMLVAAIGAAVLGEWAEGALLLFLFSLGHSLEHYALNKAKKSIAALAGLAPKVALLKTPDSIREVAIDDLKPGDVILVKPHSKIAADGIVVKGNSSVNQAPITGESMPVDKTPVDDAGIGVRQAEKLDDSNRVFAGSINGGDTMEIKVTKLAADSTIARLVKMVNEAQTQKSPTQNFTDKLEKYYVPAVLILVVLLLFAFVVVDENFGASFYRAMAVLVAASPCALAISTPSAVLSGVARAARGGVLVKGGRPLEELGSLTAIAFDKTGTLTEGKPRLTGVYPLNGVAEERLLEIVIAVEKLSDHPLAAAIVKGGMERLKKEVPAAGNVSAIQGRGIRAAYNGTEVYVGNKELFTDRNIALPEEIRLKAEELEQQGNTTMLVQQDNAFIGVVALMDVARDDARQTLAALKKAGIRRMIMLTGDNQRVADAIAKEIGITDAWGNLLPQQKVEAIEKLKASESKVAMVGDGVNDAPAMARSTVGIAMGAAGSDVALETADIALMADKLGNLPFAIGLSKKAHRIIRQNVIISLGMVAILIPLTISGIANMGPAVIGHEGSTLIVVLNALRLLGFKKTEAGGQKIG